MLQGPTTFPASFGSYALLKVLSTEGVGPVFLAAARGHKGPCVIKAVPLRGQGSVKLALFKAETKRLVRMHSPHWVGVLDYAQLDDQVGVVMEYVSGKSLAAIRQRTEEYSVLLPPELGLVVAYHRLYRRSRQ